MVRWLKQTYMMRLKACAETTVTPAFCCVGSCTDMCETTGKSSFQEQTIYAAFFDASSVIVYN